MIARSGAPYGFNYVVADQSTGLFIRATIYDITNGGPGVLVTTVNLFAMPGVGSPGSYAGVFTPDIDKVYNIVSMVYTDNTYSTIDPNFAPGCETVQSVNFATGGTLGGEIVGLVDNDNELTGIIEC